MAVTTAASRGIGSVSSFWYSKKKKKIGVWRSLVAHFLREEGVGGSNPLTPTIFQRVLSGRIGNSLFRADRLQFWSEGIDPYWLHPIFLLIKES